MAASTDMDENPPDTFNKEADKVIEEMKLKVVYTLPSGSSDDSGVTSSANRSFKQGDDDLSMLKNASIDSISSSVLSKWMGESENWSRTSFGRMLDSDIMVPDLTWSKGNPFTDLIFPRLDRRVLM